MLENKYGEYEALENQRILMERMNVETQEEIDAIIKQDMEDFVAYADSKMDESINNYYEFYTEFNSWFDDFFESYTDNLAELAKLNEQFLSLLNVEDYLNGNEMNIGGGLASLGTLSKADRDAIYAKVDLGEDYSLRMEEAIRDGQYGLAQEYALLREAKADIMGITLGQGNYRTNQQVWDDAMEKYGKTYSEEVNNKINDVQNDIKTGNDYSRINNDYASQNLNAANKSNTILQNQTTQLSNGLTQTQISIIEQAGYTIEAIENMKKTLSVSLQTIIESIKNGTNGWIDGSEMSNEEISEALANGLYIDLGNGVYLDPNKKAPVYNTVDEDPGVVGSKAWEQSVRDSYKQNGITYGYNSIDDYIASEKKKASSANTHTNSDGSNYTNNGSSYTVTTANGTTTTIKKTNNKNSSSKSPSMERNTDLAGQTVSVGGYTLTYNKNGQCTSKVKNKKNKSYSEGLENGPVTYTGLAMLHGAPSAPEYVLNNDQAYNLLYNLSVAKNARMAEFDSIKGSNGIQYIVQGDIVLEGVDDPSKFWQEVTTAMGNRWNVTKHK